MNQNLDEIKKRAEELLDLVRFFTSIQPATTLAEYSAFRLQMERGRQIVKEIELRIEIEKQN